MPEVLNGLPEDVRRLLAAPPVTEKKLLELGLSWPDLSPGQAQLAEALRLFAITWDPLERQRSRPTVFATANGTPDGLDELVVYVPCWTLTELATAREGTAADVLSAISSSAVGVTNASLLAAAAAQNASDALPAARDALSQLDADDAQGPGYGAASVRLITPTWADIGLGAITDIVQHAVGRVDLDRSPVELTAAVQRSAGCPACAGRRFGYPGELAESQDAMCATHHAEAHKVINQRTARANASNPDGWAAIIDASRRLDLPHLPNGLASKLPAADESVHLTPGKDELATRAELVVAAARWFHDRPSDLAVALGVEPGPTALFPDWLADLPHILGRAGLADEAIQVADALSQVDPPWQPDYFGQVTLGLAEAGKRDAALARIDDGIARWPASLELRTLTGEAFAAMGDLDGAELHFEEALERAADLDDVDGAAIIRDRMFRAMMPVQPPARSKPAEPRRQPRRKPSRSQRRKRR